MISNVKDYAVMDEHTARLTREIQDLFRLEVGL